MLLNPLETLINDAFDEAGDVEDMIALAAHPLRDLHPVQRVMTDDQLMALWQEKLQRAQRLLPRPSQPFLTS